MFIRQTYSVLLLSILLLLFLEESKTCPLKNKTKQTNKQTTTK